MDTNDVRAAARQAGNNPALLAAARVGFAVNGLLHLVIAWLGFQLALGGAGGSADQSGALQTLASTSSGPGAPLGGGARVPRSGGVAGH